MFKGERKIVSILVGKFTSNWFWVIVVLGFMMAIYMRFSMADIIALDMKQFLLPWYNQINESGFSSLSETSSNYNALYIMLIYLATRLPLHPAVAIKLFSFVGDFLISWAIYLIVVLFLHDTVKARIAAVLSLFLPTVLLNSAYWGQCDSIYSGFALLAVYACLKERWTRAFILLGLAIAFKLQAVFIIPAFIILYCLLKKFTALNFCILPAVVFIAALPLAIQAKNPLYGFQIYAGQVTQDSRIHINYPNSTYFFWPVFEKLKVPLVLFTAMVFVAVVLVIVKRWNYNNKEDQLLIFAWSAATCVMFLPGMHERYGYLSEILLILWAFLSKSRANIFVALVYYMIGFCAVFNYALGIEEFTNSFMPIINLSAYGYFTYKITRSRQIPPSAVAEFSHQVD